MLLCATACASGGGSIAPAPDGGGGGSIVTVPDAGIAAGPPDSGIDAGIPDAGLPDSCVDKGPLGGGDWRQYRHDGRGGSENAGVFAAAEVANLREAWPANEFGQ